MSGFDFRQAQVCHCKNCQKQTGSAFSVLVGVPKSALSIQGTIKTFRDTGGSGQAVERNFCQECGSPIFTDAAAISDVMFIKAGTIGSTLQCTSIATVRSVGLLYPKEANNSRNAAIGL
jgi:hypothetical protein